MSRSVDRLPVLDVAGDAVGTTRRTEGEPAPPADPQQLREEIKRTREQLRETVGRLAAKTDVKARSRDKATELAGRTESTMIQGRRESRLTQATPTTKCRWSAPVHPPDQRLRALSPDKGQF